MEQPCESLAPDFARYPAAQNRRQSTTHYQCAFCQSVIYYRTFHCLDSTTRMLPLAAFDPQ